MLLKYFDQTGFVFFTNYGSHKARDIEDNPQVCMMLPWVMLERQIIIYGKAVKVSRAESLKYFLTRPRNPSLERGFHTKAPSFPEENCWK